MSYLALYRKWRPMTFKDVVEQEHVMKTLTNSVITGRIAHAYLFCGTRGTGKTTTAKIFSRAVNCLNPVEGDPCNKCEICQGILNGSILDVIEIDAASNNSVDNIRDIRDEVVYTPSKAKYRVYIIDEVHMLSTGAFNALLKTLEEPPSHVIFILATTEPHKLPATILSRCQRFDFRRIPVESIAKRVEYIAGESGVKIQREASILIAKLSDGALRDAISILDQCISLGKEELTHEDVLKITGIVKDTFISETVEYIINRQVEDVLKQIDRLVMDGKSISQFVSDLIFYYRNLLICSTTKNPEEIIDASEDAIGRMKEQCKMLETFEMVAAIKELSALEASLKWSAHPRILLETALIKLSEESLNLKGSFIAERVNSLEKKLSDLLAKGISIKGDSGAGKNLEGAKEFSKGYDSEEGGKASKNAGEKKGGLNQRTAGSMKGLEVWKDVLKEIKDFGRMSLYIWLMNTKIVEIDDRFIGVVFSKGQESVKDMFLKMPENIEFVEEKLCEHLGRKVKIKCIDAAEIIDNKNEEKDEFLKKAEIIAKEFDAGLNIIDE
ncbi:DNA polymerase III subunit gamma/tau [Acetivibrio saccincola]|uniref:DNA-directed DNA polymerase n=1 Tax=Acetivibrio saccincola TaxID=1677857 RepID=A0A2K9EL05_9FIRM|nr:DNA polymerase III subunit gamma/tau [Acetivibrio saccincola]AUG56110.1 DNA polymerase III subunit tau [Acetivibrio saccincola]NLW26603.1 DNA polymerase III subunit gamma/tau [Acetivibrio saccincola]PQQ65703.1 DNA polymerase III subunit gamma/tau [Acetivibrio saccincola]HOA96815.1 DNA polymerase III subunit gamma/tau [Acetivibrio saccincola]HQD29566.1 DNA polymerase III subunit gamma/tau [Acetivibrio saccincola]